MRSLRVNAYLHKTTVRCISKMFEVIGGMPLRLRIAVDQNKQNLAGVITTNFSMVGKDFRATRCLEGVMLEPKAGQMLNVVGWCHEICVNIQPFSARPESSNSKGLSSTQTENRNH